MRNFLSLLALLVATCACRQQSAGPIPFPKVSEPYAITEGPHDHLLASYFGINSWSPDGRYVSVLET
ncbi:MAG: hypothetical protein Q4F69_11935, partial [Bacteroidia bacterium]|nr:hypothetical protein [Bacteroidia bacterium]